MTAARYTRAQVLEAWPELPEALRQAEERERKWQEAKERAKSKPAGDADHERRYALAALQDEHDKVAAATEKQRNVTLNKAAFALGQLVGAGALERHEVEDALEAAADTCGLSGREVPNTIRSGIDAGMKDPRVIPEPKKAKTTNTWKDSDKVTAAAQDGSKPRAERTKVILPFDFHKQALQVVSALNDLNDPPSIFQRGRELARIVRVDGKPSIDPLTPIALRAYAQSKLELKKMVKIRENTFEEAPANMTMDLAGYILAADAWPFPPLDSIIYAPTFTRAGELVTSPGYSLSSRTYLDLGGFTPRPVPTMPTGADVKAALTLIFDELLADFPLVDEASRAHALALGLQPYIRPAIDGPTPLFASDASTPGTGKSLLVEVLTFNATGLLPKVMTEGRDDDEWRKRITSTLLESPAVVLIDNVNRRLDSSALSAVLTSRYWTDRILGQTKNTTLPNMATWVATGNNLVTSNEIARRLIWIRLDAKMEQPWKRDKFKHDPLMNWVNENRHELVGAFLTLIQHWVAEGRPKGSKTLGSYESWAGITGGILEAAGVTGFLGNLDKLYDRADAEAREWKDFIALWDEKHGRTIVTLKQLFELAVAHDALLIVRGDGKEHSQKIRLGKALVKREDRIVGDHRIVDAGEKARSGAKTYQLESSKVEL